MDRLWAPWRAEYILGAGETPDGCIFCIFPSQGPTEYRRHQILVSTERAFVMMNRYPYNSGHVMVIPRAHAADPTQLSSDDNAHLAELLRQSIDRVRKALAPHG